MQVIERTEGCYDAQEMEFGTVYRWRPEHVVVECDCGKRPSLTGSATTCECGMDHAAVVQEALATRQPEEETLHPWRYAGDREDAGVPF